jgi:hypothetical protein
MLYLIPTNSFLGVENGQKETPKIE